MRARIFAKVSGHLLKYHATVQVIETVILTLGPQSSVATLYLKLFFSRDFIQISPLVVVLNVHSQAYAHSS